MSHERITVAMVAGGLTTGGVESMIYSYVSHMPSDSYDWIYISYDTPDADVRARFEAIGFRVFEVTKKKENFIKSCREVYRILKDNRVRIVHSNMTLMCFITNILGRMAGADVLISHSHLELFPGLLKRPFYAVFKLLSRWSATDFFTCGRDAAIYLFGKKNVEQGKVYQMNNALDVSQYVRDEEARKRLRGELGLDGMTVIGHAGRFTEQKNHEFLVRIFAEYQKLNPDSRLLLAGSGPLMERIKAVTGELGVADKVIFYGSTSRMQELYSAMDFFLFPSLYEGFGIVAIEAQAAGLKVLASDRVAPETVLGNGIRFLSLNEDAAAWASEMQRMLADSEPACDVSGALREHGLEIGTEAAKLDNYYHRAVERKHA